MSSQEHTELRLPGGAAGQVIALLVVDSHLVFADALADQFRKEIGLHTVHVAHSVEEACTLLEGTVPDVVIVHDESLAHDELAMLDKLTAQSVNVLVLVLSVSEEANTIIAALRGGARGWISKDMDLESLKTAIAQVAQGNLFLSPPVLTTVVRRLLASVPKETAGHRFVDSLSQRELEIMQCLVGGMTKNEIAAHLFLSIHTVRSHVQRMMNRADEHSTVSLIALARHEGISLLDKDDLRPPGLKGAEGERT